MPNSDLDWFICSVHIFSLKSSSDVDGAVMLILIG